jgi:glycosyltransferase involved in cell wall biosynthesis
VFRFAPHGRRQKFVVRGGLAKPNGAHSSDGSGRRRTPHPISIRTQLVVEASRRRIAPPVKRAAAAPLVSLVVPLRDEAPTLAELQSAVADVMDRNELSYELIFVDDGSRDGSADALRVLVSERSHVQAIRLRRSFGKAAALATGFKAARGAWVVTLDADLQDDPEDVPRLLSKLCEGYDLVSGWKEVRRDPLSRRLASKTFNLITRTASKLQLRDFNCGLKAYSRECALELIDSCYGEQHRFLPVIAHWKGFRVTELPVNHRERAVGRSRYGLERYLRGMLDLITTVFLSRYARRPMHVFGGLGLLLLISGAAAVLWLVFDKVALGASIGGRPLLILGAAMFLAGLQLVLTGLVAEMVSRLPSLAAHVASANQSFPTAALLVPDRDDEAGPPEHVVTLLPHAPVVPEALGDKP